MAKKKSKRGGKRPGAGRPKLENASVPVPGRVPADVAKRLESWAKKHGVSRSAAVAEAIKRMLG